MNRMVKSNLKQMIWVGIKMKIKLRIFRREHRRAILEETIKGLWNKYRVYILQVPLKPSIKLRRRRANPLLMKINKRRQWPTVEH